MIKKFFISIIKSLIVLLVATLIFSTVTFNFPDLMKGVFGDIFKYASPDAQKQVINKLTETCSSLELKGKSSFVPDLSNIGSLCKDYKDGKISDKEFFFNVVTSPFSDQQVEMPRIGFLEKYNQLITYLNNNKIIYFVILSILIVLLSFLIVDFKLFLITLSGICLSLGTLILLPYLAILVYDKLVGIDTTSILGNLFGAGTIFDAKAVLSVILLLFLRTYTSFILTLGVIFLIVGIAGRVYQVILKRRTKTIKEIKSKKK